MRYLGMFMVVCGVLMFGSLMGVLLFVGWALASESGTRWALDWARQSDLIEMQLEQVDGRVLGPLELKGFRLKAGAADVSFDRLSLEWRPIHLLLGTLRIDALEVGSVSVILDQGAEPEDAEPTDPAVPGLPIGIEVTRLGIGEVIIDLPVNESGERARQTLSGIALEEFRWAGETLSAQRIAATHALSGSVEALLDARLAAKSVDLKTLSVQTVEREPLQLDAKGIVRLDDEDSRLSLGWSGLRWPLEGEPQFTSRTGTAQLEGTPEALRFETRLALGDSAELAGEGSYEQARLDAKLRWTQLQWPLTGQATVSSAKGALEFKGAPESYRYTLDADLAAEGQQGVARVRGQGSTERVVLESLSLDVAGSNLTGRANVAWQPALTVDADVQLKDVNPALVAADFPGRINGALTAQTTLRGETPEVTFKLALRDSVLLDYPLQLDAEGRALGEEVTLKQLVLTRGNTRLTAQGKVTPPFNLEAALTSPDLLELWPSLGGRAELELSLKGPLKAPHLRARGEMSSFQFQDALLDELSLDADMDVAGRWDLDLRAKNLQSPTRLHEAAVSLEGSAESHEMRITASAPAARVLLAARGALNLNQQRWSGQVAEGELVPAELAAWTLEEPANLAVDARFAQLEPACWRSQGDDASRLCVQALRNQGRLRAAMRADGLDLSYISSLLPEGWTIEGGLDGTAVAERQDGRWVEARADFVTRPLRLARTGETILAADPGSLRMADGENGSLATLRLPLQGGHINLDATLAGDLPDYARRPLDATLDVRIPDIAVLRVASTEIEHASGSIEGKMHWTGSVAQPEAAGKLQLIDGRVHLASPGIRMTDIQGDFNVTPDQQVRLTASARSGEGALKLAGAADLSVEPMTASLEITGDQFQATDTIEARAWISPDLKVSVLGSQIDVNGKVLVPRAEITPVNFESGVGPSSDQVIITPDEAEQDRSAAEVNTDIRLVLGEDVRFEGFGLKTQFLGSLRVIEKPGRPGIGRGEIRMEGGRYKAYGQDLEITTGRVIYNAVPLNQPAVEIRAVRRPAEDVEVGVLVRGNLTAPEFQLFSTPAMPRERQLSWLVLGRVLDDGGGGDERQMLANAALAMGLSRSDKFAKGLAGGLKLDDISIGSGVGESPEEANLTVGKYLSPKLYVSYGFGLFQPGQVFKLLYDLGRGFKVSTESGVHTGGDLLYGFDQD